MKGACSATSLALTESSVGSGFGTAWSRAAVAKAARGAETREENRAAAGRATAASRRGARKAMAGECKEGACNKVSGGRRIDLEWCDSAESRKKRRKKDGDGVHVRQLENQLTWRNLLEQMQYNLTTRAATWC